MSLTDQQQELLARLDKEGEVIPLEQVPALIDALRAELERLKERLALDCGDNSCLYAVNKGGMRTNGGCRCEPRFSAATIAELEATVERLEQKYRKELWLGHGHMASLYGDDGEMQCSACLPYGVIDYKRDPLEKIEEAVSQARTVHLKPEAD